jgi:peptidoglycan hydrolase-like protein with peptidoglycan-binding domain
MDKVKPTLRKGAEGESVKELQTRLNDIGYDCGTVDGKFGNKTLAAVKEFQRKHGLTDDGVVGRQTWAELLKSTEEKEPTYKVICYGMTFEQLQKIREICPTAEVHKE